MVIYLKKQEIDYFELTAEDLAQFKMLGKRSFITRIIFFLIVLPIYIILILGACELPFSCILILVLTILYVGGFFATDFIYFSFKPLGIRYGRVSKKIHVYNGKYSGYKYNVYFDDINKRITNVLIHPTKEHLTIAVKDKVKVIKTRFGALYIFVYEYYDRKNTE